LGSEKVKLQNGDMLREGDARAKPYFSGFAALLELADTIEYQISSKEC
jgi:hypothetical protein